MIKKLLKNKAVKGVIIAVLSLCLLGGVAVVGINAYMISYVSDYIFNMYGITYPDFTDINIGFDDENTDFVVEDNKLLLQINLYDNL